MKYERIYTIGCFDQFHKGHEVLLTKMKSMGKEVIVGIHDDASLEQLKNLTRDEHNDIETRIANVREFADAVYVVPHKDPTFYLMCMIMENDNQDNACFVRANDMPNFPGREFVESKISLEFVEYTQGVSSTQIRAENKRK